MKTSVTTAEAQKIFVTSVAINTGPKGEQGDVGVQGAPGIDGKDGFHGLKGEPGEVPEAPINGKIYQRYNSSWIEAPDPALISDHNTMSGRNNADGHPIAAITGLQDVLDTHAHTASDTAISVIGTPVHDNVQEMMDSLFSAGLLHGGEITDGGAGTVNIAAGDAMIKAVNDVEATLYSFDIVAQTGIDLIDNTLNYLYIEYNAGAPRVVGTPTKRTDLYTNIFLGNVFREGTVVHINTYRGYSISDPLSRLISRLQEVEPMEWADGAMLSETGTLNVAVTAGAFWEGLNRLTTGAFDSSGADTFLYYYQDGASGWTEVVASAIVPEKYDDLSGTLATIGVNRYSVHWVYVGTDSDIYVLYGYGNHVVADAIAESAPSAVPPHIEAHGRLIGKIIVQESTTIFYSAESAFDVEFSVAAISSHLNLTEIGTNTHTQIDTHLGSIANPHGVTAAQVGAVWKEITGTTYTLIASDAGKILYCTDVAGCAITVPDAVMSANDVVSVAQEGAAAVTFIAGAGTTMRLGASFSAATLQQYAPLAEILFRTASIFTMGGKLAAV